jgi:hypothetical protein
MDCAHDIQYFSISFNGLSGFISNSCVWFWDLRTDHRVIWSFIVQLYKARSLPAAGKWDHVVCSYKIYVIGKWRQVISYINGFQCTSPCAVIRFPVLSIPFALCHTDIQFRTLYHTISVLQYFPTIYQAPHNLLIPSLPKSHNIFRGVEDFIRLYRVHFYISRCKSV